MSQVHIHEEDFGEELTAQFMASEEGNVLIGKNVILEIVKIATTEMPDVVLEVQTLPGKIAYAVQRVAEEKMRGEKKEGARHAGEPRDLTKGIYVEQREDGALNITVSVRMAYGKDMSELGVKLRKHIKATVEKMTHAVVRRVDVNIVGILTEKERIRIERERGEEEERN